MYERFTDRARKVLQLANQEAQRFNHDHYDAVHILLGLVKEGSGVAANILKNLDLDLRKIRTEVEKLVQSGPEMVTMGKLPQTPLAKIVIQHSMEEARSLNINYVGTEHILLGLLRISEGVVATVLTSKLELELGQVRQAIIEHYNYPNAQLEKAWLKALDKCQLSDEVKQSFIATFAPESCSRCQARAVKAIKSTLVELFGK